MKPLERCLVLYEFLSCYLPASLPLAFSVQQAWKVKSFNLTFEYGNCAYWVQCKKLGLTCKALNGLGSIKGLFPLLQTWQSLKIYRKNPMLSAVHLSGTHRKRAFSSIAPRKRSTSLGVVFGHYSLGLKKKKSLKTFPIRFLINWMQYKCYC